MSDKIFQKTVMEKMLSLTEERAEVKNLLNHSPEWSEPKPIDTNQKFGGESKGRIKGVYKIIYKPFYEGEDGTPYVMYIGQGNVSSRRNRHKSVFKNKGKDIVSPNGHVSPSQAGKKMYIFDDNIDNWLFSYCNIGVKSLCSEYEKALQKEEEPEFNNSSMSGCN